MRIADVTLSPQIKNLLQCIRGSLWHIYVTDKQHLYVIEKSKQRID